MYIVNDTATFIYVAAKLLFFNENANKNTE